MAKVPDAFAAAFRQQIESALAPFEHGKIYYYHVDPAESAARYKSWMESLAEPLKEEKAATFFEVIKAFGNGYRSLLSEIPWEDGKPAEVPAEPESTQAAS